MTSHRSEKQNTSEMRLQGLGEEDVLESRCEPEGLEQG